MARVKKMTTVTRTGNRLEQLKNLAMVVAAQIDTCKEDPDGTKSLAQLARQYQNIINQIAEIEGTDSNDDEIGEILSARKADGKSDAVR